MKSIFSLIVALLGFLGGNYIKNNEYQLNLSIEGLEKQKGFVRIAIFNTEQSFLTPYSFISKSIEVEKSSLDIDISLPGGKYAISAYHDLNSDAELNLNFLGIPKEPYGFSNNPKRGIGPAKFEDAAFLFKTDKSLSIELR